MHRLALESARVQRSAYICAPCRRRLNLESLLSARHQPYALLRNPCRSLTSFQVLRRDKHSKPPKPQDAPSNDPTSDSGAETQHSPGKEEAEPAASKSDQSRGGQAHQNGDDLKEFKKLVSRHETVRLSVSQMKQAVDKGENSPNDPRDLDKRVSTLERTLTEALASRFTENSNYRTQLQNRMINIARLTENLRAITAKLPKSGATGRRQRRKARRVTAATHAAAPSEGWGVASQLGRKFASGGLKIVRTPTAGPRSHDESGYPYDGSADDQGKAREIQEKLANEADATNIFGLDQPLAALQAQTQETPSSEEQPVGVSVKHALLGNPFPGRNAREKQVTPAKGNNSVAYRMSQRAQEEELPKLVVRANLEEGKIQTSQVELKPIPVQQPPVRGLSYGLDRVLFNSGIYRLQDLRSKVYNFDPYLEELIPVQDFDFSLLPGFITSSQDKTLQSIARSEKKKYTGSSSSLTSALTHFHFLLSRNRPVNLQMMSTTFPLAPHHTKFTPIVRTPASIFLRWKDGIYAIDGDKEHDSANVLSLLGNSLEKLLTLDKKDYLKYRKDNPEKPSEEQLNAPETYHYTALGDILMRSQLDAYDSRLPGTGMFDLKTRAVWPIRMSVEHYQAARDYEIKQQFGKFESFEREYLDMLRATMMKYMLQARIGRMDGIFVAFHNTQRLFGCQYTPLEEIDLAIHGQYDRSLGDQEFKLSVQLLNEVLNRATKKFPETTLRMTFKTSGAGKNMRMLIFVEPTTEEQADEIQNRNKKMTAAISAEIMAGKPPVFTLDGKRVVDYSVLEDKSGESAMTGETPENPKGLHQADGEALAEAEESTAESAAAEDSISELGITEDPTSKSTAVGVGIAPEDPTGTPESAQASALTTAETSSETDAPAEADSLIEEALNEAIVAPAAVTKLAAKPQEFALGGNDADTEFLDEVRGDHDVAAELVSSGAKLLVLELKVANSVNGVPTLTPGFSRQSPPDELQERLSEVSSAFSASRGDQWDVDYMLSEFQDPMSAWTSYLSVRKERDSTVSQENRELDRGLKLIRELGFEWSRKGQKWRAAKNAEDEGREKTVLGDTRPVSNKEGEVETTSV